jgi:hypothetical protein
MPKTRNTRVVLAVICAGILVATLGTIWLLSGNDKPHPIDGVVGDERDLPKQLGTADPQRVRRQIIATTQDIVRSHLEFGKSARFVGNARLGPAFKGLLLVTGHVQSQTSAGKREVFLYEAYVRFVPADGGVQLWMLDLNGRALYLSDEARAFREMGGNKFAGTPAEERQWAQAIATVEAVIEHRLGSLVRTEGQGRNARPWCMRLRQAWAVAGTAFTSDGTGHPFAAEVSRETGKVITYTIDEKEYGVPETAEE